MQNPKRDKQKISGRNCSQYIDQVCDHEPDEYTILLYVPSKCSNIFMLHRLNYVVISLQTRLDRALHSVKLFIVKKGSDLL